MYPWLEPHWQTIKHVMQVNRLGHAWLLLGDKGLGKEQLALHLASAFLCQQPQPQAEPCGRCHACQLMSKGHHPDFSQLPEQTKTIGVDAVREIALRLQRSAQLGHGKVVLMGDAERMTEAAANALLKTLEEPAGDSLLILIASHRSRLLPTILSRCHQLNCHLPDESQTLQWLADQGIHASVDQVRLCQGAPLRVLAYLEQQQDQPRHQLLRDFSQLQAKPMLLKSLCQALQQDLPMRLNWLDLQLADALKMQAGCPPSLLSMPGLTGLTQSLCERYSSEQLLNGQQQLLALKRNCQPGQLSNPTIYLMNWLNSWL